MVASHQAERVTRLADGWARLDCGLLVETGGSGVEADVPDLVGVPARVGPRMSGLRNDAAIAWSIARKDARAELRGRQATVSTLFFAGLVLLLFGFALGPMRAG